MKNFFFVAAFALLAVACSNAPKGDKTKVSEAQEVKKDVVAAEEYKLIADSSSIAWVGTKPSGQHNGSVSFQSGTLQVKEGEVVGGSFVADMTSIDVLDLDRESEWHGKLVGHLKDKDFFHVDSFPTGKFEIVSVEKLASVEAKDDIQATHKLTGNLELKGISKSISLLAQISVEGGVVKAQTAKIVVDRTEWDIKYKSKKFFEELKDKFISDDFSLAITLQAAK